MTDPWLPVEGCETMEYRNPSGETVRFRTLVGTTGRMMPPVLVSTLPVPAGHGSRYLGSAHLERAVALPVAVPGVFDGRTELRRWASVLDPSKGEGTLSVVDGDYAGRQLRCVYEAGLDELAETSAHVFGGVLVWRAANPYWEDSSEFEVEAGQDPTEAHWFPFLPLVLGASDAFAAVTLTNDGDTNAWPVVTVTGPGTGVRVANVTTGLEWELTGTLTAAQVLEVDTRPGFKTVRIDGVNSFNRLTPESVLWPIVPGPNQVTLEAAATSSATRIRFGWRRSWLAA